MKKKQQTKKNKNKFKEFMHTLKPILIFSFIINLILIGYIYYLKNVHHTYLFTGSDDYLSLKSGVASISYDVNLFEGNGLEYIYEKDYEVIDLKIGYYVMNNDKLEEIVTYHEEYEEAVSLKNSINDLNTFNAWDNANKIFNNVIKDNIETNLYVILEAKTKDKEDIVDKLKLEVSKLN